MWSLFSAVPVKLSIILFLLALLPACSEQSDATNSSSTNKLSNNDFCNLNSRVASADGKHRIALILGVSQYKSEKINDLKGASADAKRFYQLLTDEAGFQFPKENVCMLLDSDANKKAVINAFQERLIKTAKKNDIVVFYYAGHGSQITDKNNDEPDNMDETFVLHDSRSDDVSDFIDDEFNKLLSQLYKKTNNISIFLDSCNSGTAARGDYTARFVTPLILESDYSTQQSRAVGDSTPEENIDSMPGIVLFTAASDGTSALERSGRGIFTDALLSSFASASGSPMTYLQASRKIPAQILAQQSNQIPYFQGNLEQFIFSSERIKKPFSWDITKVVKPDSSNGVHLSGTPMPGMGVGAELRIFPGNTNKKDSQDIKNSKATIVIDTMEGLTAKGHVNTRIKKAAAIQAGDYAVLVSPSDKKTIITVSFRNKNKAGAIPAPIIKKITHELKNNINAGKVIRIVPENGDFELAYKQDKGISIIGPENKIRAQFVSEQKVIHNLWQHARHRALLQLHGEGGKDFVDNQTLQVQLIPTQKQNKCSNNNKWQQAPANTKQLIPLCHKWQIKVSYQKSSKNLPKLLIGGVIQSSDGNSFGLPNDGSTIALSPGEEVILPRTFIGQLPLDTTDTLIIFGTQETNPVHWYLLTDINRSDTRNTSSPLQTKIDQYLTLTRGIGEVSNSDPDTSTWTMSIVPMRVEANSRFLKAKNNNSASEFDTREYTIQQFNILPYLPDNEQSPLYRVLQTADQLAKSSINDGYPYTQHDWSQGSDAKNLQKGIDCSRSIWYSFTRSGLDYNRKNNYLTTKEMATDNSLMNDEFIRCDNKPLEIGDVLVYRDDTRGDGHTIMVIDPQKRIAWGSHGWDGSGKALKIEPDTGVEYQLIKYKKDWQRWDRKTMFKKACWRYKQFTQETSADSTLAHEETRGYQSLKNYCQSKKCVP
ncbi:MAG: caspase family protein [Gammaproteobacteria bacterium]|nr:caspase family protein [Gammaproteobacteria bacterium]